MAKYFLRKQHHTEEGGGGCSGERHVASRTRAQEVMNVARLRKCVFIRRVQQGRKKKGEAKRKNLLTLSFSRLCDIFLAAAVALQD